MSRDWLTLEEEEIWRESRVKAIEECARVAECMPYMSSTVIACAIRALKDKADGDETLGFCLDAADEIERLRAALQRIADENWSPKLTEIAIRALKEGP